MSKCALKHGFTARCSDISHNKKLTKCCSRLLECPSPVNMPLCPAAHPTSSAGLQGPDPTDQYGRRRELMKPQWPLTSNMTVYGTFSPSMFCWQTQKSMRKWLPEVKRLGWGKAQAEKHKLGFIWLILCQLCVLLLLELPPSTCLNNTTTHFWSHNTFCLSVLRSKSNNLKIGLVLSPDRYLSAKGYWVQ